MAKNVLSDDDDYQEFKGVQLKIKTDLPRDEEDSDSESVAKLSVAASPTKADNNLQDNGHNKPAVLSGTDVISPILSLPKRVTASLFKAANGNNQQCTDILVAKPFENINPKDFFSFRSGLVENAIKECQTNLIAGTDDLGEFIDAWLLTEISLWDNEKERLVLLTEKYIIIVKYDFIALKQLEHRKVALNEIDTIIIGDLIYPPNSLIPDRGMLGVRLLWNSGKPLPFIKRWNPFSDDIPLLTFTSHPLYWHKDSVTVQKFYDISDFEEKVGDAINHIHLSNQQTLPRSSSQINFTPNPDSVCKVIRKEILLDNYVGVGAVIHNKNSLGFFKVRGKFSF